MMRFTDIVNSFNYLIQLSSFPFSDERVESKKNEFTAKRDYIVANALQSNSLYIDQLKELYIELYRIVFDQSADEQLRNLLEIYLQVYPNEARHIYEYLHVYHFNSSMNKSILLKGDVQSGKTAMMILTAMMYLITNRDVVVIMRNKDDDKKQFKMRFEQFVQVLSERNYIHQNFKIIDKKDSVPNHACIFIDIYRKDNIQKIIRKLRGRHTANAVLYIDEADNRDEEKDKEFIKLVELVGTKIFVSATVQDILVAKWGITGGNIIPLFQSEHYRGIDKLEFIIKEEQDILMTLTDICTDPFFVPSIPAIDYLAPPEYKEIEPEDESEYVNVEPDYGYHPIIALINVDRTVSQITNIFNGLTRKRIYLDENRSVPLPDEVCAIKYTGQGISLYHSSLIRQELEREFNIKSFSNHTAVLGKNKNASIKSVLLWLLRNGGRERFPRIIIIAGDLASRGINFACHTQEMNWHLTHQILLKSNMATASTIVQSLRILGNHGDDIPLKLYTTDKIKETIMKCHNTMIGMLDCIINADNAFHQNEFIHTTTDAICHEMPIYRRDIPRNFLARKNIRDALNVVQYASEAISVERDEDVKEETGMITNDEILKMQEKFTTWYYDMNNTKIAKIVAELRAGVLYTKQQILELFTKYELNHGNWNHLFRFETGNTNSFGKVLKDNGNNTYQIYPELEEFHKILYQY